MFADLKSKLALLVQILDLNGNTPDRDGCAVEEEVIGPVPV